MMNSVESQSYRQQLNRIAQAMSAGRATEVVGDIEAGCTEEAVRMFVDDNLNKRYDKLSRQVDLVKEVFEEDELDSLFTNYIRGVSLSAYDSGQYDAERFLIWLSENHSLTAIQRDHIQCQRARHAVENLGRRKRREHVRFQELASLSEQLGEELGDNASLKIHLNPVHVWTTFQTNALLDEDAQTPADVLFFAVRNDMSTAVLEDHGRGLLTELASLEPVSLTTWSMLSAHADRDELIELCRDMAAMGLVAFS